MVHPAIVFLDRGQYDAGADWCEQAIAADPVIPANYWYLGLFRLLQGDAAEAQAVWFAALTNIDPAALEAEMPVLLELLQVEATRRLQQGHAHQAEAIYTQILELDENQPLAYWQLGNAVSLQGKLDEALDYWQTATQRQPDLVAAYIHQAQVWQKLEQWTEAIAAYQQAIALQPTGELRYQLALCLAHNQQWGAALEQLNQVIALQPELAAAYSDRGWIHLELNQWTNATLDFQLALQTYSDYAQIYDTWVEQLQQAQLPVSERLRQNAAQLQTLSVAAAQVWQQRVEPPAVAPPAAVLSHDPVSSPVGYYLDTQTWVQSAPAARYIPLDPGSLLCLQPPKTCDRDLHFSFRLAPEIPLPETFVVTLPNGRSWLSADQSTSAILTATNELLGDLSPEFPLLTPGHPAKHPAHHSIFQRALPAVQTLEGTVAVLSGLTSDMYFHWLFDVLPRIDLLRRSGIDLESIDYFWVNSQHSFQQETLQRLGIPSAKWLAPDRYPHVQASQLIVPSYPGSPAWMPKRVCDWLRELFLTDNLTRQPARDRLYITRQHTTNRRIINESDVMASLQTLGFQSVALEALTVQQQAALLASAEVVISAHGGGLTNLTFCQPGTKIIEIFSPNFVYPCYWLVSNLLNLDYYYITGTILEGHFLHQQLYPNPRTEDIWVNLQTLQETLALAGIG